MKILDISSITNIGVRTLYKWRKERKDLFKVIELGTIAEKLGYTESELKFLREKRERELYGK
jgi:hypothetical protein